MFAEGIARSVQLIPSGEVVTRLVPDNFVATNFGVAISGHQHIALSVFAADTPIDLNVQLMPSGEVMTRSGFVPPLFTVPTATNRLSSSDHTTSRQDMLTEVGVLRMVYVSAITLSRTVGQTSQSA
jgi:hypothetical protein